MSYYVIKGPWSSRNYLCSVPGHACPQWIDGREGRSKAYRFPDEDSAWKWLQLVIRKHEDFDLARVVRVNTLRDWKAERAMLRSENEALRTRLSMPLASPATEGSSAK